MWGWLRLGPDHRADWARSLLGMLTPSLAIHKQLVVALVACVCCSMGVGHAQEVGEVTPNSPEVKEVVKKAMAYLDKQTDRNLGGKCLIGLTYLKTEPARPDHPRVKEALAACIAGARQPNIPDNFSYSNGLAIIFLCELNPRAHSNLIKHYLGIMKKRQKEHGGWGYTGKPTGDTSQTQYAAFSFWEAHDKGFSIESSSVEGLTNWLMNTQDPTGAWGYQGHLAKGNELAEQEEITCSMVAAALGSSLIAADMFGLLQSGGEAAAPTQQLSDAIRNADEKASRRAPPLPTSSLDQKRFFQSIKNGNDWMDKNYQVNIGRYNVYYLYSLERYKSFQEVLDNEDISSPQWYRDGFEHLRSTQGPDGSWNVGCGPACDTAFAVLFLIRSTKKILDNSLAEGLMISGRGLPKSLKNAKLVNGQLVVEQTQTAVGDLLNMLDGDTAESIDAMASDPTALIVTGEIDEQAAQRLRQLVRSGSPVARRIAVRTLGRTGDLDNVPTLIYAMTDPDKEVVRFARDALRFISRRFEGFGLQDRYADEKTYDKARYGAIDKWKNWYLSIRPNAIVTLN